MLQIYKFNNDYYHFNEGFNNGLDEEDYNFILKNTKIALCPKGWVNTETFRLYETLETGTIPIYVRVENDAKFWDVISKKLQLINLDTWDKAIEFIKVLLDKKDFGEKYRLKLIENWKVWKDEIKESCQKLQ